jgi:hypothetical protein
MITPVKVQLQSFYISCWYSRFRNFFNVYLYSHIYTYISLYSTSIPSYKNYHIHINNLPYTPSLHFLLDYECLLFYCDWLVSKLRIGHFFSFCCPLVNTPQLNTEQLNWLLSSLNDCVNEWLLTCKLTLESESESYFMTDGQPASLSWNKAPFWGLRPDLYYCLTVVGLLILGALSDERTGLSFTIAVGPRQCSHFRVRVP